MKIPSNYIFDPSAPGVLPELIVPSLRLHGVDPQDILLCVKTDMDVFCAPCECFLLATQKSLYRICGVYGVQNNRSSARGVRKTGKNFRIFCETDFKEWGLSEFSSFSVDELASTCRIIGKQLEKKVCIANLSLSFRENCLCFCSYLEELTGSGSFKVRTGEKAVKKELYCPKCGLRYADPESKLCLHCRKPTGVIKRTAALFRNYRLKLALVVLLLVLSGALSIVAPYFSAGFFYDEVLDQAGAYYGRIFLVIFIIVFTRILTQLVSALHMGLTSVIAADMVYDLRKIIFSSINRLSVNFFTSRKTGGLMTQVNSDSQTIYWFFCDCLPYFAVNLVQVIAAAVIMFLLSPPLCIAAVFLVPASIVSIRFIFKKMNKLHNRRFGRSRSMNSALSDILGGVRVVKAFSGEENERKRFSTKSFEVAKADLNASVYSAKAFPSVGLLLQLGNILVWALGGVMILTHYTNPALIGERAVLTYGTLATFITYVSMIYSPLFSLVDMVSSASDSMNAMGRLIEIMDAKAEVLEREHPITPEKMEGKVCFEDVSFEYQPGSPVLEHISFELEAGKTLGIVGKTGAGKTTLANLLIRLYDPTDGRILIDGIDLKDLSFEYLRRNVAIVSQDTYLFSGSILENVRYARPEASLDEVFEACAASGAHEFIMKLRDGYHTMIGQGNADLSGGERQRLSIARAILKNPKILILDEATAAMDTRTEQIIQNSITALSRGRTTLIIAHRLSTLKDADELIVIDKKRLVEKGTPEKLIRDKGLYFNLYKLQLEALKNIGITEN